MNKEDEDLHVLAINIRVQEGIVENERLHPRDGLGLNSIIRLNAMRDQYRYRMARREAEINATHDRAMPMVFQFPSQRSWMERERIRIQQEMFERDRQRMIARRVALARAQKIGLKAFFPPK